MERPNEIMRPPVELASQLGTAATAAATTPQFDVVLRRSAFTARRAILELLNPSQTGLMTPMAAGLRLSRAT